MKEREIMTLWIAGTAVAASAGFVVLGIMLGGSPLVWNIARGGCLNDWI